MVPEDSIHPRGKPRRNITPSDERGGLRRIIDRPGAGLARIGSILLTEVTRGVFYGVR
jgi:hypothetical protein